MAISNRLSPAASQALDVMRGTAALLVLLNHWRELFFVDYPDLPHPGFVAKAFYFISGLGHQSVTIFFVLSGFLVGGSVIRQWANSRWSWGHYLFARGTRLYMVLVPALLLGLAFDGLGLHIFGDLGVYGAHGSQNVVQSPVSATITPAAFLENLSFLQTIAGPTLGSNSALWSLAYEFWYYILFPCILLSFAPKNSAWNRISHIVLALAVFLIVGPKVSLYFLIWLMGAAIVVLPACGRRLAQALFAASILALSAALAWIRHSRPDEVKSDMILGLLCAALIYSVTVSLKGSGSQHTKRIAGHLANSSYTLYLVHLPALVFASSLLVSSHRWLLSPDRVPIAVVVLGLIFLYAQLVYFMFEANTDRLRNIGTLVRRRLSAAQPEA